MNSATPAVSTAEIAHLFTTEYDRGTPDECRLLHTGLNDTYAVRVDGAQYALRVHGSHKWWIGGEDDLRFELGLLDHLDAEGLPVSVPLARRHGDPLGRLRTSSGDRFFTLFTWAPGRPGDGTPERVRLLGETLAAIHVAADTYQPAHSRYTLDERSLLDRFVRQLEPSLQRDDPADVAFVEENIADIRRRIRTFDPGPGGWGVVHGDVQSLNIHFTGDDQITFLDFDLCGYGWRAYDVAYYYTRIPERLREPALRGYESVRPLNDSERDMLPTIGRLAWIREGCRSKALVKRLRAPFMSFA